MEGSKGCFFITKTPPGKRGGGGEEGKRERGGKGEEETLVHMIEMGLGLGLDWDGMKAGWEGWTSAFVGIRFEGFRGVVD